MTVKGENIINSLINSTRYPISMKTSRVTVNILDKVVFTQAGDLASLQEKLKEIKKERLTGYVPAAYRLQNPIHFPMQERQEKQVSLSSKQKALCFKT